MVLGLSAEGLSEAELAARLRMGTPAVVTRIAGHSDAVAEGRSGLLVDSPDELVNGLDQVLADPSLRARLARGAQAHADQFTWAATARGTLEVLAAEALRRRGRP